MSALHTQLIEGPGNDAIESFVYRDPRTLQAVEYYFKIPQDISDRDVLVCDPMLATAHSAIAAVDRLCASDWGRMFHRLHEAHERQVTELHIRASILNQFTALGTPQTVAAA